MMWATAVVVPSAVDCHAHFRDPGPSDAIETFESGQLARRPWGELAPPSTCRIRSPRPTPWTGSRARPIGPGSARGRRAPLRGAFRARTSGRLSAPSRGVQALHEPHHGHRPAPPGSIAVFTRSRGGDPAPGPRSRGGPAILPRGDATGGDRGVERAASSGGRDGSVPATASRSRWTPPSHRARLLARRSPAGSSRTESPSR